MAIINVFDKGQYLIDRILLKTPTATVSGGSTIGGIGGIVS